MIDIVTAFEEVLTYLRTDDQEADDLQPDQPGYGAPYFLHGTKQEIDNILVAKSKDKVYKYQRYPLIALRLPVIEDVEGDMIHYTINMAIISNGGKDLTSAERKTQVFDATLNPLYDQFIRCLRESGVFSWSGNIERPEHNKVDRMYYGTLVNDSNRDHQFTDPIDAIEIIDLKISKVIE